MVRTNNTGNNVRALRHLALAVELLQFECCPQFGGVKLSLHICEKKLEGLVYG